MDKNDLKSIWHEAHDTKKQVTYDKVSIDKSLKMNHCKTISKILSDLKIKILVYTMVLVIYLGLMLYALVYLGLQLSVYALVPLILAGLFFLIKTTSEIFRLLLLTKTADNMSVKESLLFFRKKLDRIRKIDFLSYLIFLYLSAILIMFNYISDIGGVKNLSLHNKILPVPLLAFLILLLLIIPWLIKYQHNQRYKKIYSNLCDSDRILNIES